MAMEPSWGAGVLERPPRNWGGDISGGACGWGIEGGGNLSSGCSSGADNVDIFEGAGGGCGEVS